MKQFANKLQNHVRDFHIAFNHPAPEQLVPMERERAINRSVWTAEEAIEFIAASCSTKEEFMESYERFLTGMQKAYEKSLNGEFPQTAEEKVIAQADALADQLYFSFGSAVEIGVDIEPVFDIVQGANMSKLFTDENGNKYAKCREDGKIIKSPDFYSPEPFIKEEVLKQMK
ncbi:hypothetical protein [Metasolibacillus meyeri]|uniref:hypothetical protein n=1 Tax=Metasolibacillus meyeri TaxID=1071052 RepID=UPI000D314615|nr:hypothetical protein [Metasolibacillus meyeri]